MPEFAIDMLEKFGGKAPSRWTRLGVIDRDGIETVVEFVRAALADAPLNSKCVHVHRVRLQPKQLELPLDDLDLHCAIALRGFQK